jgi:hypothetical protein
LPDRKLGAQHGLAIQHPIGKRFPVIPSLENLPGSLDRIAPDNDAWKLFVFRKSRDLLSTAALLQELRAEVGSRAGQADSTIDALVRAGEIETGLADAASPVAARVALAVDELAGAACGGHPVRTELLRRLEEAEAAAGLPPQIRCAHPEGFSYYGLHPLDFADLASRIHRDLSPRVQVVGIRSVGSTLGSVVAASLRAQGKSTDRITVRPQGEPYQRKTTFDPAQLHWIALGMGQHADFVVVDEGPGFSGSTFRSVAWALVESGVAPSRIVLMGSRPLAKRPGMDNGESCESSTCFRSYVIDYGRHTPQHAGRSLGDGAWRELLYPLQSHWPACWIEQERIKYLSQDDKMFFKFEGFGRYGGLAHQQASALAQAGFSPQVLRVENGFAGYEWVRGRPLNRQDLSQVLLSRIAAYCAFRGKNFPAANPDSVLLSSMTQVNLGIEFGLKDLFCNLPVERPVYPDCCMSPHEWLLTDDGQILKTDAVGHGEGHQLPGPADIAWDLAGAILEWKLSSVEAEFLLEEYQRFSGDRATPRVSRYVLPYSVFRMARCRMGAAAMGCRREARYLYRLYKEYSQQVKGMLEGLAGGEMASLPSSLPSYQDRAPSRKFTRYLQRVHV